MVRWTFARGLLAALLVLSSVPLSLGLSASFGDLSAHAQGVIQTIRVEGNRRVEPETVRSYLNFNSGDAYDPAQVDESIKALFATGLFADVRIDRDGATVVVPSSRTRSSTRSPSKATARSTRTTLSPPRCSSSRAPCSPAPASRPTCSAFSTSTAGRAVTPLASTPRSSSSTTIASTSCSRSTRAPPPRSGHQFHRQRGVHRHAAARHHLDDADKPARLPQGHQHLRSRPVDSRSRAAASILPEERLCRRPHRLGGAELDRDGSRLLHHFRHRRRGALQVRRHRYRERAAVAQCRRLARLDPDQVGPRLQLREDRQDDREADARRLRAGLCFRPRQARASSATRQVTPWASSMSSTKARASTSSASTSSAICAPRTTSSAASSGWRKATPTTRCWSTGQEAAAVLGFFKTVDIKRRPAARPTASCSTSRWWSSRPASSPSAPVTRPAKA